LSLRACAAVQERARQREEALKRSEVSSQRLAGMQQIATSLFLVNPQPKMLLLLVLSCVMLC
jgi:hypothetical protein